MRLLLERGATCNIKLRAAHRCYAMRPWSRRGDGPEDLCLRSRSNPCILTRAPPAPGSFNALDFKPSGRVGHDEPLVLHQQETSTAADREVGSA